MKHGVTDRSPMGERWFYIVVGILMLAAVVLAYIKLFYLHPGAAPPLEPIFAENVREPYVAGMFYPAEQGNLRIMVDSYLKQADDLQLGDIKAIVVPHAGYIYSGQVAAHGFKQLESRKGTINKVFLLGSNHAQGAFFQGISVANYTHYRTPLGKVKVAALSADMRNEDPFTLNEKAHTAHILEVELPFLQRLLGDDFEIVPMVWGGGNQDTVNDAAKVINDNLDASSVLVVSTDLSHYHPYDTAVQLDTSCIAQVENQSFAGVSQCEACGSDALLIL
ncbi:AmmeMemoRadiSam system protein B, partial [Candidatus Woesearchaeota archaeon]|nr:AmmeMemoRadiSam system protein B [Candidatus Woesearchaeota archaeon]